MNDTSDRIPGRLTFTCSEEELWAFQRIYGANRSPAIQWETRWTMEALFVFGIPLIVVAAYSIDLLRPPAVLPVLFTAYLAFAAGVASYGVTNRILRRKAAREVYRTTEWDKKSWTLTCDAAGLTYGSEDYETRVAWRGVRSIEEHGSLVMIWFYVDQFPVPARVFRDDRARVDFVAWVAGRISAARTQ